MSQNSLLTFVQNRNNIVKLLSNLTLEQVNAIPDGHNNNIVWNAGHVLLGQQLLIYHMSRLNMAEFAQDFLPKYGSGTRPHGLSTQAEIEHIIKQFDLTAQQLIDDLSNDVFETYQGFTSEYFGFSMENIDEAVAFNTYHETFHFGVMNAMRVGL